VLGQTLNNIALNLATKFSILNTSYDDIASDKILWVFVPRLYSKDTLFLNGFCLLIAIALNCTSTLLHQQRHHST